MFEAFGFWVDGLRVWASEFNCRKFGVWGFRFHGFEFRVP